MKDCCQTKYTRKHTHTHTHTHIYIYIYNMDCYAAYKVDLFIAVKPWEEPATQEWSSLQHRYSFEFRVFPSPWPVALLSFMLFTQIGKKKRWFHVFLTKYCHRLPSLVTLVLDYKTYSKVVNHRDSRARYEKQSQSGVEMYGKDKLVYF